MPPSPGTVNPLALRVATLCVLLAAGAAYAPSLPGSFTLDDRRAVADRADYGDPGALVGALPASLLGRGRAVTDLTFAAGRALHGVDATLYRAGNVAIHLLVALLLISLGGELLRRAGLDRPWWPVVAGALWALHPLGSEAVAYVCQRAEALSAGLAVAAILVVLKAERWRRPSLGPVLGAALVLLSLGAKGIGVMAFAAVALVLAAFPGGGAPAWRRIGLRAAPLLVPALVFALGLLGHVADRQDVGFSMAAISPADAWRSQGRVVATYLRLALWPVGQSADRGLAPSTALDASALAGWAVVAVFAALCAAGLGRRRDPSIRVAAFGGAWFLLWLAPTSALPIADLLVEHRAYLPLFGLALAGVALADLAVRRAAPSRGIAIGAGVALALITSGALGALLARRAALWGDPVALWTDAIRVSPAFYRPYTNLAKALREDGRRQEEAQAWRLAVERWPASNVAASLRYVESLRELAASGRPDEAAALLAALPENVVPAPSVYAAAARLWIDLGRAPVAELLLSQAAVINDYDPEVMGALALTYAAQGRLDQAIAVAAVALDRSGAPGHRLQLADLLSRAGRVAEACRVLGAGAGTELEAAAASLGCR